MTETFDMAALTFELKRDEGQRLKPYLDTVGKMTIGVGRNLSDIGISHSECTTLLENDIARTLTWLDHALPWWRTLDMVRQRVLINMAFNLGGKLLTFVDTLTAMQGADYAAAANGMLASKWAKQVGARSQRLTNMMRTGKA
ncbi:lysozyme [Mycoavidus sp. SF9855]|uniref:glycoside hydrolase family protein n=1 Tax=Mycoavidus sp. SF9855 TaxID=2968475 RepID=UPI00211BF8EB|nr:lysozyme [Mycoavidus sp. SF9855]UUM20914.1 lysozyme [Mycoavidus sp. SF9855]